MRIDFNVLTDALTRFLFDVLEGPWQPQPIPMPVRYYQKLLERKEKEKAELRNEISKLKVRCEIADGTIKRITSQHSSEMQQLAEHLVNSARAYTEADFWERCQMDLRSARKRVIIVSPFVGSARVTLLINDLKIAIDQGARVGIVTRPQMPDSERTALAAIGACIWCVPNFHQKLLVIDDILWEGSMNVLSHLGTQPEHMRRITHEAILTETVRLHHLHHLFDEPVSSGCASSEDPCFFRSAKRL